MICIAEPGVLKESQSCWYQLRLTGGASPAEESSLDPSRDNCVVLVASLTSISTLLRGSAELICSAAMVESSPIGTRVQ